MATENSFCPSAALRNLFSNVYLRKLARETGMVTRKRKIDPVAFFWTLVLGFGQGRMRQISTLRRFYQSTTGCMLEESSFYYRFNLPLVKFLKQAVAHALQQTLGSNRPLEGILASFRDVLITDSTVLKLHQLLEGAYAGCRTTSSPAAAKVHLLYCVSGSSKQKVQITSERHPDGKQLKVGPWVKDRLMLFELGYYRFGLFNRLHKLGGFYISRMKTSANPKIVAVNHQTAGQAIELKGQFLQDVLPRLKRQSFDLIVELSYQARAYKGSRKRHTFQCRLVGIRNDETGEYHAYFTNIPMAQLDSSQIASVYQLRWQIELLFKELKQHYRLDQLPSTQKHIVEALIYTAILSVLVSRRLMQLMVLSHFKERKRINSDRWAALFASQASTLLTILLAPSRVAKWLTKNFMMLMHHEVLDPHLDRSNLLGRVENACF